MKIKNTFVANSSSSSYVLLIERDAFENIKSGLTPLEQAVADAVFKNEKAFGKSCKLYATNSGEYSMSDIDFDKVFKAAQKLADAQNRDVFEGVEEYKEYINDIISDMLFEVRDHFEGCEQSFVHEMDW